MNKLINSAKIYDLFAKHYRGYSSKKTAYIEGVDNVIVTMFKGKAKKILDFGSGDGIRGVNLFKKLDGDFLLAGDVSIEMIQLCKQTGVPTEVWDLSNESWKRSPHRFDLIVSLWNVFGHIPTMESRVETLKSMSNLLAPGGQICFDVNNRHYKGYGKFKVLWRRLIDYVSPDFSRGDVTFEWEIDGVKYPAHGHLFTFSEVQNMVSRAGLRISYWSTIDYLSGKQSRFVSNGQLLFILEKE